MALITISGGIGSGAESIAPVVAEAAKLDLYDDQRLQQEAGKMGIRSEELKNMEKVPGFFDVLRGRSPELYLDVIESIIYEVSRSGRGVILGHGSPFLLRDFGCAFHVLIHAPETRRIQRIVEHRKLSSKAAEKMMNKSDHERRGFMRFAFHMDWNDPSLYDLVINTGKFGIQGAADLILNATRSPAIQECSFSALESMERMSLVKKVEAALLKEQFGFTQFHVEVPERGTVHVYGYTNTADNKRRMLETAKNVPGVSKIVDEVGVLPPGGY